LEPQGRKIISKNKKERDELYRQLTDIMALYQQEAIRQLIAAKDGVIGKHFALPLDNNLRSDRLTDSFTHSVFCFPQTITASSSNVVCLQIPSKCSVFGVNIFSSTDTKFFSCSL
jgi:hypothetical protein